MIRLLELVSPQDTFGAVRLVLDKCPQFFQEYYQAVRDYEDGLRFTEYAFEQIKAHRKDVMMEQYMRWDICLISLRLEMLDMLGRWGDYQRYFIEVFKEHPNYQGAYAKTAKHLKMDRASPYYMGEDDKYFYAHFLYLLLPRFEAIGKLIWAGVPAGRAGGAFGKYQAQRAFLEMTERLHLLLGIENNIIKRQKD
jgi:hypothetical protein